MSKTMKVPLPARGLRYTHIVEAGRYTAGELAQMLRESPITFESETSRIFLAELLDELLIAREASYEAKVALAKIRLY
jgi:hypothetical protein